MQSKMFHPISLAHALPDNSYRLKDMEAASNDMPNEVHEVSSEALQTSDCIKPGEHVNAIGETSCAKLGREDDGEQGLSSGSWRDPMFQSGVTCENCLNVH